MHLRPTSCQSLPTGKAEATRKTVSLKRSYAAEWWVNPGGCFSDGRSVHLRSICRDIGAHRSGTVSVGAARFPALIWDRTARASTKTLGWAYWVPPGRGSQELIVADGTP